MSNKIAVICTHPIQYYAPVFASLAEILHLKVFYTLGSSNLNQFDRGFGKNIEWDIPLLKGYDHEFLINTSKNPNSQHFNGIDNPDVIKKIEEYAPTKILIYGWAHKSHLKIIRYFSGRVPIYFRGDSTLLNQSNGIKSLLRKIFLRWLYKHIDNAFYVGSANKNYFTYFGLNQDQLIFAPHAIDNQRFAEDRAAEAKALRCSLKIDDNAILVLFAGKFDIVKNPEILLNAFLKLNLDYAHLLFVGNGVLEEKLKKVFLRRVKSDKIVERIHFMNFKNQTEMPIIYQACDLFCLPSYSESWGLAINEAMAAGKAILASNQVGCASDLVKDKCNGTIFKSGNEQDFKEKLVSLCENKLLLKDYGKCSVEIINNWSFEKQVALMATELQKNAASK